MTWCGHEGASQAWAQCRPKQQAGPSDRRHECAAVEGPEDGEGAASASLNVALKRRSDESVEKACLCSRDLVSTTPCLLFIPLLLATDYIKPSLWKLQSFDALACLWQP